MYRHAATLLIVLLAACSTGSVAPSPRDTDPPSPGSASPAPAPATKAASPRPTATEADPSESDGLVAPDLLPYIEVDSLATVVTDDLVVRSLPEISDASAINPVTLQRGRDLFVMDGPVAASGHSWYHVAPIADLESDAVGVPLPGSGWVAAGTPADPWIAPWTEACPRADLSEIWREPPLKLLACFGGQDLHLDGLRGACSYAVPSYIEPYWLNHAACELLPHGSPASEVGRMVFTFHQPTAAPPTTEGNRVTVRVTGHFDDPAANTCVAGELPGAPPPSPELIVLACRSRFVATEVTELAVP